MMTTTIAVPAQRHTAPRAAGLAGVIFSVLVAASIVIVRLSIPEDPSRPAIWLTNPAARGEVRFALHLVPFAGIAFLWFIAVFRDRLGDLEDRFFATVFLGSGFLFVACLFGATVMAGSIIEMVGVNTHLSNTDAYYFGRWAADMFLNVFGIKMAGVFTFTTCTISLRTAILPRWVAFTGFACGLVLLVVITHWLWIVLLFPLWMLLLSVELLLIELRT
jgi:hypothetical protein